mmetsp:Transcript_69404/g.195761  ORF Transcript_69404/g.195761 Transcript_69404/m.195761 type:complete len:253 (+) Transcript_69404:244-1002(+)
MPAEGAPGSSSASEVLVVVADSDVLGLLELLLVLGDERGVDLDLRGLGELADELQAPLVREAPGEPEEGLLEVVVAPGAQVVVLQVALAVELDVFRLDLPVLHVDLVPHEDDRDVLADSHDVAMPVRDVLVGDARGDVEHDDRALALDVVPVAEAAELLLARRVPDVEGEGSAVRREPQGVDLHTQCRDVLLLELAGEVPLHQGGLAHAAVADEHQLELWHLLRRHRLLRVIGCGEGTRSATQEVAGGRPRA